MATFCTEVSPYKRRDNTYLIKVRVTHNRATIRKPLGIYATAEQLNRDRNRIKDASLSIAAEKAVDRLRQAAASVEFAEFLSVHDLWRRVTERIKDEKGFSLDFVAFSREITAGMEKGTADGYKYALHSFCAFLGRDSVDVNEITRTMAVEFREWIEKRNGKGCRAASAYLEKLRHIHNRARDKYNDPDTGVIRIPREPFKGVIPPHPKTRHRALTLEQMRAVVGYQPKTRHDALAKDVFLLSFCLIGMNTADLHGLRKTDLKAGVVTYNRRKTRNKRDDKAVMSVRVEPEAAEIIARHKGRDALLDFSQFHKSFRNFNKYTNVYLKDIGAAIGVPGLDTYYARHTWATLARNRCGVDKDTVRESLNHASRGSERVTDIYVERDFGRVWDANRKVLDLVFRK